MTHYLVRQICARTALLLLIAASPAAAQVTVTLSRAYYHPDSTMTVTVSVAQGGRVAKPRLHVIGEGKPLPNRGSRGWVDFPEIVVTQAIEIRVPAQIGRYWLIANDDGRMIGRVMFEVLETMTVLQLERDRLVREGVVDSPAAAEDSGSKPGTEATPLPASNSPRGYLRLAAPGPVPAGGRFEVVVTLHYVAPDDAPLELRWGKTTGMSWPHKEAAPDAPDLPPRTAVSGPRVGLNSVAVTAPGDGTGPAELRLFRGSLLLDALTVIVRP